MQSPAPVTRFRDRAHAGKVLAELLGNYAGDPRVLVLALPRGGVPVAYEIAIALGAPLDIFLVRKLGVPGHEELAFGAIATGGGLVLNDDVVQALRLTRPVIQAVAAEEETELERREHAYRGDRPEPSLDGRIAILVDDGLATGASMRAAVNAARSEQPARLIVAVPTAAPESCDDLKSLVDEVHCAITPAQFQAVGLWYENFDQTSDEEVKRLLKAAADRQST